MPQSKDIDGQIGQTVKTHWCAVFRNMQGHTKAQNKAMEEDLPSKCRAKKKQELHFSSLI